MSSSEVEGRWWPLNGAIRAVDVEEYYFLDPTSQDASRQCVSSSDRSQFVLLSGSRASGKTTRLYRLKEELDKKGFICIYISLEGIDYKPTRPEFWSSFGCKIRRACKAREIPQIATDGEFIEAFESWRWEAESFVIIIDELSEMYLLQEDTRTSFLRACRAVKHQNPPSAIRSIIGAGTFSVLLLDPEERLLSPFNINDDILNPYFSIEECRRLFQMFAQDQKIIIDDAVSDHVWALSNGYALFTYATYFYNRVPLSHPAMVCICGRAITRNLERLVDLDKYILVFERWERFPLLELQDEILSYSTFRSRMKSLKREDAAHAVDLLRSRFAGYLGYVDVEEAAELGSCNFLTAEGVLMKEPHRSRYRIVSPLIDSVIRMHLIPAKFSVAPKCPVPLQHDTSRHHVLNILIEAIKVFDKTLLRSAIDDSFKTTKLKVDGGARVPRESVSDTELMRILRNWLAYRHKWKVTGQLHLRTDTGKHKYSDIVLETGGNIIVLELLATGDSSFVKQHIEKTPEYQRLLSAREA